MPIDNYGLPDTLNIMIIYLLAVTRKILPISFQSA